jgi:hypothetical protein
MEHHSSLDLRVIGAVNLQQIFFDFTSNTETEVFVNFFRQLWILLLDEVPRRVIDILKRFTDCKFREKVDLRIECKLVRRLLLGQGVYNQSSTGHRVHIAVLSADVHIEYLALTRESKFVIITFGIEVVQNELRRAARLQQHRSWVIK